MIDNNDFKNLILKKYPSAILYTDQNNYMMAAIKQNNVVKIVGCVLCFGDSNIQIKNNNLVIDDIELISANSLIEDDSKNPAMGTLFFCPICHRIIPHPNIARQPVFGKGFVIE